MPHVVDLRPGLVRGFALGATTSALVIHLVVLRGAAAFRDTYQHLSPASELPWLTALTLSRGWAFGVPLVGVALILGLVMRPPRGIAPYAIVAVLAVLASFASWYFPTLPLTALSNRIAE
jgi:hypothetical protein